MGMVMIQGCSKQTGVFMFVRKPEAVLQQGTDLFGIKNVANEKNS